MDYYERIDYLSELDESKAKVDVGKSNIRKLYKGANLFITGGAGFLGSLLIEKIARSCPDFGKIYLLLRTKRGFTPAQRLDKLFENEIFNDVKKKNPEFQSRVVLMEGDLAEPVCGLSEENQQILRDDVNIIFHIASCLRMTEPLKSAYTMNVRATKDLLDLGTEMKQLKGFIYVSTAYSNCFRPDISETFYKPTYNWKQLRDLVMTTSNEQLDYFTPKLLGPWVNSYAFTKAIAEDTVRLYEGKLPIAIARPSIVIGCAEEPLKGWINNVYGAVGVAAAASVGIMRVWYADRHKIADIIPADYVVNTMIAISWHVAEKLDQKVNMVCPIYNIVSSPKAPTTWGEYMTLSFKNGKESKITTRKSLGEYAFTLIRQKWLFFLLFSLIHLTQGLFVDALLKYKGKPPMLIKGYIKIMRFNLQLAFFCEREWKYEQRNVDTLLNEISNGDRKLFPFDMTDFIWDKYHLYSIRAILAYIVKSEDVEDPQPALDYYSRFMLVRKFIVRVTKLVTLFIFAKFIGRAIIFLMASTY